MSKRYFRHDFECRAFGDVDQDVFQRSVHQEVTDEGGERKIAGAEDDRAGREAREAKDFWRAAIHPVHREPAAHLPFHLVEHERHWGAILPPIERETRRLAKFRAQDFLYGRLLEISHQSLAPSTVRSSSRETAPGFRESGFQPPNRPP